MVTARQRDPLRNFQFRVKLVDTPAASADFAIETGAAATGPAAGYVFGVSRVSGLSATVAAVEHWSGGNALHPHAHPDRCQWEPITLDQGLALDGALADWAEAAIGFAARGVPAGVAPVKRGVILDVWDPYAGGPPQGTGGQTPAGAPGHPMYRYLIHNAWVSRYQAMPALDGGGNEVALLSVELTHEGWMSVAVGPHLIAPDAPPGEPLAEDEMLA